MNERIIYKECPLCASSRIAKLTVGDCSTHRLYKSALNSKIVWKECLECSHVFTEGYYTEEACRIIFEANQKNQKVGEQIEKNRIVSGRMIEKVVPFVSEGVWLDVGFGNGSLLFTAQEYGFRAVGIDLRRNNVDVIKSIGIEAYCEDLNHCSLQDKCAVISMADVLEHMPFPREGLQAATTLLQVGGVLLISMPNSESILWRVLDDQDANPYWGELEHYHNFSRTRLYSLLNEYGFTPKRYGVSERYRACMEVIALKV
jgi:predicted SAM-dependent methyltransferase